MELTPDSLYIKYVRLKEEGETPQTYPYTVPALANFRRLEFRRPVTFIMGENGMGKSTLLEAIAVKAGFNPEGGSKNFRFATRASHSDLYEHVVLGRGLQPRDGYFLRAESFYNVATQEESLYFDEPEAALSPSRQMYMLCRMKQLAEQGSQFIISTHSPIVMSYPGAEIYEITDRGLEPTELEETSHFRLMKRFILDRRGILRQMELEKE